MTYGTVNVDSVVNSDGVTSGGLYGFKNRIINGGMSIAQRGTTAVTSGFAVDRWRPDSTGQASFSYQQNGGSVTPPTGFTNYLANTSTAAYAPATNTVACMTQSIEGYNTADFAWGTANAQTVTVSFWVRSSLTGTHSGSVGNNAGNRAYVFSFTISAANTWEYKTVVIAGDTTGTWATDNSTGIFLRFNLGVGTGTYGTTTTGWQAGNIVGLSNAVQVSATNGATFYFTGVQLEKGSTATSFDCRPYGTELALCQRYTFVINSVENASFDHVALGVATTATNFRGVFYFPVTMRSLPSYTATASDFSIDWSTGAAVCNATSIDRVQTYGASINFGVASGLTANGCSRVIRNNTASPAKLIFSSEM